MADARVRVGVLPLFAMQISLAHGPLPRSTDRELTMRCRHGGHARDDARETVPYVGPRSRVVELRDMHVLRCRVCPNMTIEVPEPSHLDTLIRCLGTEWTAHYRSWPTRWATGASCRADRWRRNSTGKAPSVTAGTVLHPPLHTFHTGCTRSRQLTPDSNDLARQPLCTAVARARGHSRGSGGR